MDRKNIQKIGNVILVLAAVLLVSFSALFCIRENARLTEKQKEEFTTVYPEREAELAEICQYYDKKQRETMINFFLFAGGVVLFSAVFLEFQIRVRERKFSQCLIKNLHLFEEQLNQFLQGNYEIREEADCEGVDKETGLAMQEMGEIFFHVERKTRAGGKFHKVSDYGYFPSAKNTSCRSAVKL